MCVCVFFRQSKTNFRTIKKQRVELSFCTLSLNADDTVNGRTAPYNECNPSLILSTLSVYSFIAELIILQTVTVFWLRNVNMGIYVAVYEYVYVCAPVFVWACNRRSLTCQCSCFCLIKRDSQEFIQKLFSDYLPTLKTFF